MFSMNFFGVGIDFRASYMKGPQQKETNVGAMGTN